MQELSDENPYATPQAEVRDRHRPGGLVKASRSSRLVATIIDGIVLYAFFFVGYLIAAALVGDYESDLALIIGGLGALIFMLIQVMLFAQNGWTLGKKLLRIRVTRKNGSPCGLGRFIGLRVCANYLLSLVPLYGLVDSLFIFGEERRCLHDHLADTIVVEA